MPLVACFEDIADPAALAARWQALEEAAPGGSFFLGWVWIGSWLAALHAAGRPLPQLMSLNDAGDDGAGGDRAGQEDAAGRGMPAALALIGAVPARRVFGTVPALWLNQCGDPEGDRPFIEYNGLLCRAGAEAEAATAFCAGIAGRPDWRLVHGAGLEPDSPLLAVPGVRRRLCRAAQPVHFVDLAAVRAAEGDYPSLLGANSRQQIRRAARAEKDAVVATPAPDAATAGHWLADMRRLNRGRHADNAWDSPLFRDFVARLVENGQAAGTVELLRIAGPGGLLGYLLTFLHGGVAMNYQSAFVPPRTSRAKPGLLGHAAAVARYADRGLARYSLLAGDDRYKRSLATGAERLEWWVLERSDLRLNAEALLRALLRRPLS